MRKVLTKIFVSLSLLVSFNTYAGSTSDPDVYTFEGGTSLIDLYSMSGTTNLNAGDDQVSAWSPDFGFDFEIWGQTYRKAKMSTNGCVNFTGLNCSDYTPQPLPYRDKTLYPFWTDLIRGTASGGQTSKMLYKGFEDYVVFGWYYMREYYRSSSNSFEAILYANNSYEYRYRELDIIQHDVLIGEQNTSSDHKTYRFYDDNSGGHNTWDSYDASFGDNKLENGGSLNSTSFEDLCNSNQLYSTGCSGYAAAYLAQQCGISSLYSSSCSGYAAAYLAQQCGLSALYSTSCSGYAAAYFSQQCGLSALYNTECSGYAAAYFSQQCGINALYDTDCSGYAVAYYTLQCDRDALYDSGCDGYWEEIAYQDSLVAVNDTTSFDDSNMYGYDDDTVANSLGYESEDEYYGYDYDDTSDDTGDGTDYYYDDSSYLYDDSTDQELYAVDVTEFGQVQVADVYETVGPSIIFTDTESVVWEEDEYLYEDEVVEVYWANIEVDIETFPIEVEINFIEETLIEEEVFFEEEEVLIEEDIIIEFEDIKELEEIFLEPEPEYETLQLAQVLNDVDIFILQEETGLELLREKKWKPTEELEIYVEVLEDYERDALEELAEEKEVEFIDEIDETVIEELINEEVIEELIDEEDLDDEAVEQEFYKEPTRILTCNGGLQCNNRIITASTSSISTTVVSDPSGVSTSQEQVQQITQDTISDEHKRANNNSNNTLAFNNSDTSNDISSTGVSSNETQNYTSTDSITPVVSTTFDNIGQVNVVAVEPMAEIEFEETIEISTTFADVSVEFEQTFNDALGAGQSIGQFLSNDVPNFARFNIEPPTIEQSNTIAAVESLADRVGTEQAAVNLQAQLQQLQDGGGFVDQTVAVAFIGYRPGFSAYTNQIQLADRASWYESTQLPSPDVVDNNFSFYMMAGNADRKIAAMRR